MTIRSKAVLKGYFAYGKLPTAANYGDLIDTMGDMQKSDYDNDNDGKVDRAVLADSALTAGSASTADMVPWSGVAGKPTSFAPSPHQHVGGDITTTVANATQAANAAAVNSPNFPIDANGIVCPNAGTIANGGNGFSAWVYGRGGGAAGFSFHRPGLWAVNFGLDTDNKLKVGGWSLGNNAYEIYHQGNRSVNFIYPPFTYSNLNGASLSAAQSVDCAISTASIPADAYMVCVRLLGQFPAADGLNRTLNVRDGTNVVYGALRAIVANQVMEAQIWVPILYNYPRFNIYCSATGPASNVYCQVVAYIR